jgi:putative restriction endonuclease
MRWIVDLALATRNKDGPGPGDFRRRHDWQQDAVPPTLRARGARLARTKMVSLFVANTDNGWFDFLSTQSELAEVNFWQPSGKSFSAIRTGELLVFRLKSPRNKIGGYGVLSSSTVLPLQTAWEAFGRANGASSYNEFRDAIAQYRSDEVVGPATNIGARILTQPQFFPPHLWIDLPLSWALNITGGKRYSADEPEGLDLWNRLVESTPQHQVSSQGGLAEASARYGTPTLITPRLGQGAFRIAVTEAYNRQCAVSDGKVLPALDAAHIRPYADGGLHTKANGLLLRKDIHCVFDAGYATVDADFRFVVSHKVKEVFDNGNEYRRLHGKLLTLPRNPSDRPDPEFLRWHNTQRFLG